MSSSFELHPEQFTTGAVGPPGRRVFFLQATMDDLVVTLRIEKQQVAALAEYLAGILADLPPAEPALSSVGDLVRPVAEEWTVGALGVAYEEDTDRIVVVAEEAQLDDDVHGPPVVMDSPAHARFHLTRGQVSAFVVHAMEVVTSGRPLCRLCGRPVDPDGHACTRSNGHHRP